MNGEGFACDLTYCPVCGGEGKLGPTAFAGIYFECDECGGSGLNPYYEHSATVERAEEQDDD